MCVIYFREIDDIKGSVVDESNIKRRYLFFQYDPGDHGYIRSGVQSWAEKE